VNLILNWNRSKQLGRVKIETGEVLIFSPHLIHGLALNYKIDQTRVGLEFRLFKS
jgi:ectoine hydroxylase-related dioxygenase (phytanoyl-CoA dioxygenase family)